MSTMPSTSLSAPQPYPWVCRPETNTSPRVYTRPLVGSELFVHRFTLLAAGGFEVCSAVRFTSSFTKHEVQIRARRALDRLRFDCPLIAAFIDSTASWIYTPVQSAADRETWLNAAFVFQDHGDALDVDAFINLTTQRQLPYLCEPVTTFFRCYLLAGPESTFALVFHGSHALMDAWPTLNVFTRMFEWMSDSDIVVDELAWGTEWQNLPEDLVSATGGPCPTWETDGTRMLEEIAANRARGSICLTPAPDPQPNSTPGETLRLRHIFSESESLAIAAAAKELGSTVTRLLEAAHCMALAVCNPPDLSKEVDFEAEMTVASLEPKLPKSHFASCFVHLPVRLTMTDILRNDSTELTRLKLVMAGLKERYAYYLSNPCINHLLVAQQNSPAPFHRPSSRTLSTSVGVIEKRLQTRWAARGANLEDPTPVFQIDEFYLITRMTSLMMGVHSWSFKGKTTLQVQANGVWRDSEGKDSVPRRFLEEMVRQIRLLLDH